MSNYCHFGVYEVFTNASVTDEPFIANQLIFEALNSSTARIGGYYKFDIIK
jgi:hypothetical protein